MNTVTLSGIEKKRVKHACLFPVFDVSMTETPQRLNEPQMTRQLVCPHVCVHPNVCPLPPCHPPLPPPHLPRTGPCTWRAAQCAPTAMRARPGPKTASCLVCSIVCLNQVQGRLFVATGRHGWSATACPQVLHRVLPPAGRCWLHQAPGTWKPAYLRHTRIQLFWMSVLPAGLGEPWLPPPH